MTEIPQAAITAAGNAMRERWLEERIAIARPVLDPMDWAATALEAAAPHIAAAERERILHGLRGDTFLARDGSGKEAAAVPWSTILNLLTEGDTT